MNENIGLLIDDNPISRSYINILRNRGIKLKYVVYLLNSTSLFKNFFAKKNYLEKNAFAINFLKDNTILKLTNKFEQFFNFEAGFCKQMYNFNNLFDICEKVTFTSDANINSPKVINLLGKIPNTIFFNTGKQILKEVLNTKHQFLHIHPGYLPDVKGADGSLWQIKNYGNLGVSSFFMESMIDEGKIIRRDRIKFSGFHFEKFKEYSTKEIYRIWFSFFDPLLRSYQFSKIIDYNFNELVAQNQRGKYYSFMKKNDLDIIFNEIFNKNITTQNHT